MSPEERAAVWRSLEGAVLSVALHAASLRTGRRLEARINSGGRYALKVVGWKSHLATSITAKDAINFLDAYGVGS